MTTNDHTFDEILQFLLDLDLHTHDRTVTNEEAAQLLAYGTVEE